MAKKNITEVAGSAVREWATAEGIEVGTRGRFSAELIEKFQEANPGLVYKAKLAPTVVLKGTRPNAKGAQRKVEVVATNAELRAFGEANGFEVGKRGRLSESLKAAFIAQPKS